MHCPSFSLSLHAPLVTRAFHVAAVLLRNTSAVRRHRCPSSDVISRRRFSSSIQFIVPVGIRCPLLFKACGLAPPVHFFFGGGAWPLTLSCCSNYDPGWRPPLLFCSTTRYTPGFNYHCVVDPSQSLGDQSPPRVSKNKKNLCRT